MKRAAAYARYSTDKQYDTSIEKQIEDIREYCRKKGYVLIKEYVDKAESASKEDRPAFQQLLQDAKKGLFDVVVVHKLNRFARNRYLSVVAAHELKQHGVTLESVLEPISDDPVGQLLWGVLDSINEFERLNLIQEIKMKMRPLARKGYWMGGKPPYGFEIVKVVDEAGKEHSQLAINEEEAVVVRKMFELFLQGYSYSQIAGILNKAGHKRRSGKPWTFSNVAEMLKNPRYAGQHFWGRGTKKNHRIVRDDMIVINGPAIVDVETWRKAQERIKQYTRRRQIRHNYILSRLIFCECGAPMHGTFTTVATYRCRHYKQNTSQHAAISVAKVESFVIGKIRRILNADIDFEHLTNIINEITREKRERKGNTPELMSQAEEYSKAINRLTEALAKVDPLAQGHILKQINEYSARLREVQEKLQEIGQIREITVEEVKSVFEQMKADFEQNPEKVVRQFIKKVVVYKGGYIEVETTFSL